jgi:serine/threonine-protein kinase
MKLGQRVGPFDIEKQLGAGAMGAVYRARYRKTGQRVAIKVMLAGLGGNETALARFQREASVLKQLNHPNIVRFYAVGEFEGAPYYAMEYIEGESLDHMLQRGDRLTWEKVVEIGKQVCGALKHAHDKGIVHRDLKPSNLMILADGTLKLTDFGIAKDLDVTQLTSANCTVGTAAYMSPEQCKGERNLTHKSDLYSLGVVLYELLVGHKPFQAETPMDMFLLHVQGDFERPSRIVLEVPVWLDTIVCQLLEKKPEHRPLDAGMVADALDKVAEKVAMQQSAGAERAKARVVDRSRRDKPIDETDRRAAATLLTGFGRKRKKRRAKPFYTKVWFQLIAILAVLFGLGAIFYRVFRAPSAADLFKQASVAMRTTDFEGQKAARKGPIADYLSYYGQVDDERTAQVRAWAEDIDVRTLDDQLKKRRKLFEPKDDGETIFRSAIGYEEAGNLDDARKKWRELAALDDKACEDLRAYQILAERRTRVLDEAVQKEDELTQFARQMERSEKEIGAKDFERLATDVLRYEHFGDCNKARTRCGKLKLATENVRDQRVWTLIAYKWLARLKGKEITEEERVEIVKAKLQHAITRASESAKDGRAELKEIIALYREEPPGDVAKMVAEARKTYDLIKPEGN